MNFQNWIGAVIGAAVGGELADARPWGGAPRSIKIAVGSVVGGVIGTVVDSMVRWPGRLLRLEKLMPEPPTVSTARQVIKPTPESLFASRGTGTDYETRLSTLDGYITPTDRFFLRSHSPTPEIALESWRLSIFGSGVRKPITLTYEQIVALPQVTVTRTIECAGNGRSFFKKVYGIAPEGGSWRTGAIGAAEWTGVRLRDLLDLAGVTKGARAVMPEGLDDHHVGRPMPLEKALRDDTLLVLKMNGETLLPDHGFPARMLVSGWVGTASIKWVGSIEVSEKELYSAYNTLEYVMVGPHYPTQKVALGPVITEMPVMSVIDQDWPASIAPGKTVIRGRSFAGEGRIRSVAYRVDSGDWREAQLLSPDIEASWRRWEFSWDAQPGSYEIFIRATDDKGRAQPDTVPWNHHGYLYNAVVGHPVKVG